MSFQLLLLMILLQVVGSTNDDGRKIWSECIADGTCSCGRNQPDTVFCKDMLVWIHGCYCIYYDPQYNKSILGNCMSSCFYANNSEHGKAFFQMERLSVKNASEFNELMCNLRFFHKSANREGRFCGRCAEGYGLAAYSYHYSSCIPCTDYGYGNWLRYFAVALIPLTMFYFLVVVFRISITSSRFNGLVLTMQCILTPIQLRIFDAWVNAINGGTPSGLLVSVNVVTSIFGIINLDFFRTVYPYFCLHPKLNFLHVTSLDLVIAIYPFFLIFLTYVLVTMYDQNYRVVVLAWRPLKWLLRHYNSHFDIKSSLIETFATFILLSNVKILGVCFDLLISTRVQTEDRTELDTRFMYFDANIEYFGSAHLPFAVLALSAGFLFVLLPCLLLVVYPSRWFQKCIAIAGWRCLGLHVFMDAFQGSYKTEPYDLRFFSAYYLIFRFSLLFSTSYIVSTFFLQVSAFVIIVSSFIILVLQPYKNNSHNRMDAILLLLMALFYVGVSADVMGTLFDYNWLATAQVMFAISFLLLILYMLTKFVFLPICSKLHSHWKRRSDPCEVDVYEREVTDESMESTEYPSLLSSAQNLTLYT